MEYNKDKIKEQLTTEDIFELLTCWQAEPEYTPFGIISKTICHNHPDDGGKRKLYYYSNSHLFQCYTGCQDYFDIFDLVIKVAEIQWHQKYTLPEAMAWIAKYFNLFLQSEEFDVNSILLEDWEILKKYEQIQQDNLQADKEIILKEYNPAILNNFNYKIKLQPWLQAGISDLAIKKARIGYYLGGDQITIPHFDINGRLIGIRGRSMCRQEANKFGKYRPLKIGQQYYNHPLGMNLYNLNFSYKNIAQMQKAIIFEGEKSTLLYKTYFGDENDISVACCGSNISNYQIQLLLQNGAKEIIVAFDRQFQDIGDLEYKHLTKSLTKIYEKYKNDAIISLIFDKNKLTSYKDSPIDCGPDIFLKLFQSRIFL